MKPVSAVMREERDADLPDVHSTGSLSRHGVRARQAGPLLLADGVEAFRSLPAGRTSSTAARAVLIDPVFVVSALTWAGGRNLTTTLDPALCMGSQCVRSGTRLVRITERTRSERESAMRRVHA